jgi:hypothetical protein
VRFLAKSSLLESKVSITHNHVANNQRKLTLEVTQYDDADSILNRLVGTSPKRPLSLTCDGSGAKISAQ